MFTESPAPAALTSDHHQALIGDLVKKECWNFTHGDPTQGVFYSPSYPNKYPNDIECVQYLEGKIILVIFKESNYLYIIVSLVDFGFLISR